MADQTDPVLQPLAKMSGNNNIHTQISTNGFCSNSSSVRTSTSSSEGSSQTTPTREVIKPSTVPRTSYPSTAFKCLVCARFLDDAEELKKHSEDDHKLSVDLQKLNDPNEDDSTSRFLRSLNVDDDYLNLRRKYFPGHFDHIEEKIKIGS